jgi:hypothetical protein
MKRRLVVGLIALGLLVTVGLLVSGSTRAAAKKAKEKSKVSRFMRALLSNSQSVLEGIVTEDFDLVSKGAKKMILMSKAAEWHVIQGPVYTQYSAEFRRNAEELVKAAKAKNIDGVGLRYMSLTMSCISCNKFVHGTKIAQGQPVPKGLQRVLDAERWVGKQLRSRGE